MRRGRPTSPGFPFFWNQNEHHYQHEHEHEHEHKHQHQHQEGHDRCDAPTDTLIVEGLPQAHNVKLPADLVFKHSPSRLCIQTGSTRSTPRLNYRTSRPPCTYTTALLIPGTHHEKRAERLHWNVGVCLCVCVRVCEGGREKAGERGLL